MNDYILFLVEFNKSEIPVIWYLNEFQVPIQPIMRNIGINWKKFSKNNHDIVDNFWWLHLTDNRLDGSKKDTACIGLLYLDDYLNSIKLNSIPVHKRNNLEKYQLNCAKTITSSLNSPNLDGVNAIIPSTDPSLLRYVAEYQRWNDAALKDLGMYIDW